MRFDLVDLSLFRHVVEAGSITHGAERAHLALAAASTRIRNMEEALGAALLTRGRAGRDADAGRPHAAAACAHHAGAGRAAARGSRRLCGRARRPGARALQHQRAHRISARGAELVPRRPSARQRRSGGAAVRRDRRADRRGRRRHRHRGRNGRCRRARDLSVPQRPLRAGGRARSSARAARARSALPKCWITISSGSTARARCSASSPTRRRASAGRCGCACSCAAFDGVCRLVERNVGVGIVPETTARWAAKTMAIKRGRSSPTRGRCATSTICVRDYKALPPYARQLVDHMREERREIT